MIITNPELQRSFDNAQAKHESVFPDEGCWGFSVKFKKLEIEYVFHVKLTADNEEAKLHVLRNFVRDGDLTYHGSGGNWWPWVPSTNFSLAGPLHDDYFVFLHPLISLLDSFEDAVALDSAGATPPRAFR
jgi:hypothetical protein